MLFNPADDLSPRSRYYPYTKLSVQPTTYEDLWSKSYMKVDLGVDAYPQPHSLSTVIRSTLQDPAAAAAFQQSVERITGTKIARPATPGSAFTAGQHNDSTSDGLEVQADVQQPVASSKTRLSDSAAEALSALLAVKRLCSFAKSALYILARYLFWLLQALTACASLVLVRFAALRVYWTYICCWQTIMSHEPCRGTLQTCVQPHCKCTMHSEWQGTSMMCCRPALLCSVLRQHQHSFDIAAVFVTILYSRCCCSSIPCWCLACAYS